MTIARRFVGGVAAAALIAVPLAACSSSGGSSSSSSPSAASTSPVATLPSLTGKMTQVTLDPGFLSALKSLGLTPSPFGTATIDATTGVATFPITGGNVTVYTPGTHNPYVVGSIKHEGSGLNLTAGSTKVTLENFTVDPGGTATARPTLYGDVLVNGTAAPGLTQAPLFALDGSTLKPLQTPAGTNTAVLEGTTVRLTSPAAAALDGVFKTTAVKGGLTIGIAKITVALS